MPKPFYSPSPTHVANSQLTRFIARFSEICDVGFESYWEFDSYVAKHFRRFWAQYLIWSGIPNSGSVEPVCESNDIALTKFFPQLRLNYAESILHRSRHLKTAIVEQLPDGTTRAVSGDELARRVESLALRLRSAGVNPGDMCFAWSGNSIPLSIAALAVAAVGGVLATVSASFPEKIVLTRLAILRPRLLIMNFDLNACEAEWNALIEKFSFLHDSVDILVSLSESVGEHALFGKYFFSYLQGIEAVAEGPFDYARFPFNHPLFALFTSGTTGGAKCLVHGAGGTLIEHHKEHVLHCDLKEGDVLFYQTSPSWMMWNWQLSALGCGAQIVLYDGPFAPERVWDVVERHEVTVFGTSAAFLQACENSNFFPNRQLELQPLRLVLSTGSVLHDHQYDWFALNVAPIALSSISGGTDIVGCFLLGNPNLPVFKGELQCRSLGLDVQEYKENENEKFGELVCANPFPSRPIDYGNNCDPLDEGIYYFSKHPGLWSHGDAIRCSPTGGARVCGRIDGTLNVRGTRVDPVDLAQSARTVGGILNAVGVVWESPLSLGGGELVLFITLRIGQNLTREIQRELRRTLAKNLGVWAVPTLIVHLMELPCTYNGKVSAHALRMVVNPDEDRLNSLTSIFNSKVLGEARQRFLAAVAEISSATKCRT